MNDFFICEQTDINKFFTDSHHRFHARLFRHGRQSPIVHRSSPQRHLRTHHDGRSRWNSVTSLLLVFAVLFLPFPTFLCRFMTTSLQFGSKISNQCQNVKKCLLTVGRLAID